MVPDAGRLTADQFAQWWHETGEYELGQLLYWKWDPINISHAFPYTAHEYDRYSGRIVTALHSGSSVDEIADIFSDITDREMGRGAGPPGYHHDVAASVLEWYETSQSRWVEFGPLKR